MDTFKEIVDLYLKQEGRSQAYLAKKLGYSSDQLNKWLLGVNKIPYDVVREICEFLKVDKRQQVKMFDLAGYSLPKWVEEMVSTSRSDIVEDTTVFDKLKSRQKRQKRSGKSASASRNPL